MSDFRNGGIPTRSARLARRTFAAAVGGAFEEARVVPVCAGRRSGRRIRRRRAHGRDFLASELGSHEIS